MTPNAYVIPGIVIPKINGIDIIRISAKKFNVNPYDVHSSKRNEDVILVRQIIMWYCMKYFKLSSIKTSRIFWQKHNAALHGRDKVNYMLDSNKQFKQQIEELRQELI